uniref:Polyprotein allergen nematode domain-containing protein n=1 Tax=Meloidogyne floridensis TaxID=298350 RepID=A0A915P7C0_9BILA
MFINYLFCLLILFNLSAILLCSSDLNRLRIISDGKEAELKDTRNSVFRDNQQLSRRRRYINEDEYKKRKMGESLVEILKIHSIWLTEGQKEELREDLENGKSLDGEMYEKVLLWFSQLKYTFTEWSGTAKSISYTCLINSWKNLKDVFQRADIGLMSTVTLNDTDAECNNFRSDLEKLAEIVDNKRTRNDIVEQYCDLTKDNTKRREKRETKGPTSSENNLEYYFKILNLDWLCDKQREHLKKMSAEGTRLTMRDAVVDWFNDLQPDAKARATDLFKGGCNKLLKIRQEGCGYFGSLDSQKIDELKNYDDLTTFSKIKELIDPLEEKVELRQIANEYSQSCRELFGIGEEVKSWYIGVGRKRRSYDRRDSRHKQETEEETAENDENEVLSKLDREGIGQVKEKPLSERDDGEEHDFGDEHLNAHNSWLNSDQKSHIKRMRDKGHEDHEIHEKINEFHETSPEEIKITAKGILKRGCEFVFKRLFGEYIADEIIQAREQGASTAELDEKINTALRHIKNAKKRKEATRFAATCRRIFTMIERRRRDTLTTPIEDSRL